MHFVVNIGAKMAEKRSRICKEWGVFSSAKESCKEIGSWESGFGSRKSDLELAWFFQREENIVNNGSSNGYPQWLYNLHFYQSKVRPTVTS